MAQKPTIEELEAILTGGNDHLSVEIKPDGSIHAYHEDEPREQGPVNLLPIETVRQPSYY